ncbi:MAG: DUF2712 domain-containing protein [Ruminococcaceae bacterium]|nr:DUF2712 domain-containing protein [Oscillospiraceae bacterium]
MKRFKKLISITLCIFAFATIFATNAFAAATNNDYNFDFKIQGSVDNAQDPTGRYRGTTNNNHSWKVQLTSSGEGEKTITKFWIENKNGTNASSAYNIKQGNPAEYKPANDYGDSTTVYLTGENNNYASSKQYVVKGFWDEETGIFL